MHWSCFKTKWATVCVSSLMIQEVKRIIKESEIMKYVLRIEPDVATPSTKAPNREDDSKWPQKNKDGRQELEIRLGNEHISFEVMRFGCDAICAALDTSD